MPFDEDDWVSLELIRNSPHSAIDGFLNRLQRWTDWVESAWPGAVSRESETEHPYQEMLTTLQHNSRPFAFSTGEDLRVLISHGPRGRGVQPVATPMSVIAAVTSRSAA